MRLLRRVGVTLLLGLGLIEAGSAQTLRLQGAFQFRTDAQSQELLGDQVCFYPDAASSRLLPRKASDPRLAWFCISSSAQARQLLHIEAELSPSSCGLQGQALIEVEAYRVYEGEGDGHDLAQLRRVISVSKPRPLPCRP